MEANKDAVLRRHAQLLEQRYDLADRAGSLTMSEGKPVQTGVRVRLPQGITWAQLAELTRIRDRNIFPLGFSPLPHPNHAEGAMLFPNRT
jgi:hypothetical protein